MSESASVSRRTLFKRMAVMIGGLAAWRQARPALAQQAASPETGPQTVRVMRPYDAETPVREFTSYITPNHRFFVRSHFGPPAPESIAEGSWRLYVGGLIDHPLELTLKDLKAFEPVTITAVVQCSGNGRAFHRPKVPGVQWERGAVGNAQWTGVRLRDVLAKAGVRLNGKHVQLQGADRPVVASVPLFVRSIPLEKAVHPDTILAYDMNGRPLPLLHGAPLRVITPDWMADSCIKWLTDITVRSDEAKGYYMQTAYRVPVTAIQPSSGLPGTSMVPVEAMVVKSLIASPAQGDQIGRGPVTVQGVAWSGEAAVATVELSFDDGKTWDQARLVGEDEPHAWRQWQFVWKPAAAGSVTILCRATDAAGQTQPQESPWNPSGFLWNGWDRVAVTVAV
ncbi:MAG: Sulfite oxidase-like oxidoreductase [Nitrospira sp.]|nr:MAG: Sulfite oxidase-like oxidoreductase [Nitrospira sp.]